MLCIPLHSQAQPTYTPGQGHTLAELALRQIDINKEVGAIAGAASVSATGGATYSIPIDVAPGTNGMVPALAFGYNSQAGNGLLGQGWSLEGLSSIVRTGRDNYHDGIVSATGYDLNDRFMLDGQRLVCTSGTYGTVGSAYDTENASFSTVTLLTVGGSNEEFYWFRVLTKQGMTLEYGFDWNSKILNGEEDAVLVWRLGRVIDTFGNYLTYEYSNEPGNNNITSVRYTGNLNANTVPYNRVDFEYMDRTDIITRFGRDATTAQNKMLTKVTVLADGPLVRTYELSYAYRDNRAPYLT
ncbi:MAG TPA: SpvB/TcaC N-terminal domain-containing protein, partial [Flavobacteriales bacterium]|nr:SpvB/TcaC N-terminal domain-containing protein [Flavobacteriales bacterium]